MIWPIAFRNKPKRWLWLIAVTLIAVGLGFIVGTQSPIFVIGGLVKEEAIDSFEHIPILGRLPLIGRLFGTTNNSKTKTDLMVLVIF